MDKGAIIGIVITIALVGISIAVCFYLLSLKDKENASSDEPEN